jgi:hypothetical protein
MQEFHGDTNYEVQSITRVARFWYSKFIYYDIINPFKS